MIGPLRCVVARGPGSATDLCSKLISVSAQFELTPLPDDQYEIQVKDEPSVVTLLIQHFRGVEKREVVPEPVGIPTEVADRLHEWGRPDDLYLDLESRFFENYNQDGFTFGERYFYDPETRKAYRTVLGLAIEESEPPDNGVCPNCGDGPNCGDEIEDDPTLLCYRCIKNQERP